MNYYSIFDTTNIYTAMKKIIAYTILIAGALVLTNCAEEDENGCYCDFYESVYNESTGNFDYEFVERQSGTCDQYNTEGYFTESNCE